MLDLANTVLFVLSIAVFLMTAYAFVHAAMQRSDAYTATGKLTKPVWLIILGVGALLTLVPTIMGPVIAACAAGVYIVDVRPKLLEIQGKSR
jgi:4-amino-4-deoxy-L-arabinose transferase-like glycosyltransferase